MTLASAIPGRAEQATARLAGALAALVRQLVDASADPRDARDAVAGSVLGCVSAMFSEATELTPIGFTAALREADASGDMSPVWALLDAHPDRHHAIDTRPILSAAQIHTLHHAARDFDWFAIHPEIFGSIFEQALDPARRHELGAHFTREADIARVVDPTIVAPWQQRIAAITTPGDAERVVAQLRGFHVLDPACGCGNFLYVVYREMKRVELTLARKWSEVHELPPPPGPWFRREQLHGIEIDGLAASLARVVLGIGEQLAAHELGLRALSPAPPDTIVHGDALVIDWHRPEGELAIVGNPPYLGVRKLRRELGDERVLDLFARYPNNRAADYATYWFTRALEVLRPGERAGYVCTNSIAQNESRAASIDLLLAAGGAITDAWKSYPWPGEAAVHIGIVNWVMSPWDGARTLGGRQVPGISPGLTEAVDVTVARHLVDNEGLCFMGVTPGNDGFVLTHEQRAAILEQDPRSSAVIRPYLVGRDINREIDQRPSRWVIDFAATDELTAQGFPGAYQHIQRTVFAAKRSAADRKTEAEKSRWWQFVRPRPELHAALRSRQTVCVVSRVSPHLIVSRQPAKLCFDGALMVFMFEDPYHFGVLQSRIHAIWAWARGSTLEARLRYTNTTIFETFPLPPLSPTRYAPALRPAGTQADRVAEAAETFERLRLAACKRQQLGLTKIHNALAAQVSPLRTAYDALNDAVTACYGFPKGVWRDEHETLKLLLGQNLRIAARP